MINIKDEPCTADYDVIDAPARAPSQTPPMTPPRLSEAEEAARKRAQYARKEFYKNRKILVEDVPPVTYEEVKEFMGGYKIANINISRKTRNAYVILKHGEEAEEIVDTLKGKRLLDKEVTVSIKPNETLLCLAHLPFHLTDDDFRKFASQFGIIEKCFLMRNERTGESKGYGLVEYTHNRDHTNTARLKIDGMEVYQSRVHCEFILSHLTSFNDLNSKCLFINKLPPDFLNEEQLEQELSYEVKFVFSKIGMKNDQPLGFAIIELASSDDAEITQARLHGHEIRENRMLSATFCVPGMSGPELYNKALNAVGTGRSAGSDVKALGLIPTPNMPPPFMARNINNMNPMVRMGMRPPLPPPVAQGLQNLFQQLQVMQQNMNHLIQGGMRPPGPAQFQQPSPASPNPMGMGFLGPGPNAMPTANPMMQQAIALLAASLQNQQQQQQLMMGLNGLQNMLQNQNNMGPNRMQQQAFMGNPIMLQTNNFLQALVSQLKRQQQSSPQPQQDQPPPAINRPNFQENRPQGMNQGAGPIPPNQGIRGPNPNSGMPQGPPPAQGPRQPQIPQFQPPNQNTLNNLQQFFMNLQKGVGGNGGMNQGPQQQPPWQNQSQPRNQPRLNIMPQNQGQALLQTVLSSVMNTVMNLAKQGQNQDGAGEGDYRRHNQGGLENSREQSNHQQQHGNFGPSNNRSSYQGISTQRSGVDVGQGQQGGELDHGSNQGQGSYRHHGAGNEGVTRDQPPERLIRQHEGEQIAITINQGGASGSKANGDGYSQSYVYTNVRSGKHDDYGDQRHVVNNSDHPPYEGPQTSQDSSYNMYNDYNNYMSQLPGPYPSQNASSSSQSKPNNAGSPRGHDWVNPLHHQQQTQQLPIGSRKTKTATQSHGPGSASSTDQTAPSTQSSTPVNPLKRPSTCLLPGPEPSPESGYVGQHSQGIGGHYSESYKRKRLM